MAFVFLVTAANADTSPFQLSTTNVDFEKVEEEKGLVVAVPVDAEFGHPTCTAHQGAAASIPPNEGWVTIPDTKGVTYLLNGGALSPATYRLNAGGNNVLTAIAQEGYRIEGEFSQSINIGPVPSFTDCNPPPEPEVTVEEIEELDCEAGTVTTWKVTTTTEYVLNDTEDEWILGEPVITREDIGSRDANSEECPREPDEPGEGTGEEPGDGTGEESIEGEDDGSAVPTLPKAPTATTQMPATGVDNLGLLAIGTLLLAVGLATSAWARGRARQ